MPITEVTLLRLNAESATSSSAFQTTLARAKDILESALSSKRCVYWCRQKEDSTYFYIICEWTSSEEHREQFIPSESNKQLTELLQVDFELSTSTTLYIDVSTRDIPVDAPLISIGCHKVAARNTEAFEKRFRETRYIVDEYVTTGSKMVGGWRLGKGEEEQQEWVLFVGWESWEHHVNFIKTEDFKEYGKILGLLDGYESKHAKIIDL